MLIYENQNEGKKAIKNSKREKSNDITGPDDVNNWTKNYHTSPIAELFFSFRGIFKLLKWLFELQH